jgi:hypothetical protein
MTTLISNVLESNQYFEDKQNHLLEENLPKTICDLSIPLNIRLEALDLYHSKYVSETLEIINKLSLMYEMSKTKLLRQYLYDICISSKVSSFLKTICCQSLCHTDDTLGYKAINHVFPQLDNSVGTPYKIELLKILMRSIEYKKEAREYFCKTVNDQNLDCDYRYKVISKLENDAVIKPENIIYFMNEAYLDFFKNNQNKLWYRILASKYLLTKSSEDVRSEVENLLLSFATNTNNEYNLRADATDTLLQSGSSSVKIKARNIISQLGKTTTLPSTIYNNAQNVHSKDIEDSVKQALEFLQSFEIMKYNNKPITLEYVTEQIQTLISESKTDFKDTVGIALNRISIDRSLYGQYNCTLSHILLQVWTYISGHKSETEMRKRLIEELFDMALTCSSGFASRLVNTISGFGDFSVKISWREQIASNFSGRLNAKIRDMDDLNLQEKILAQITLESSNFENRKHFLKFLRKNIPFIREELWEEFKLHMNETDFDLYLRGAVCMYETGKNF